MFGVLKVLFHRSNPAPRSRGWGPQRSPSNVIHRLATMARSWRSDRRTLHGFWPAFVFVLAGFFGMHGLGAHGTMAATADSTMGVQAVVPGPHAMSVETAGLASTRVTAQRTAGSDATGGAGGMGGGFCLAVLVLTAAGLVWLMGPPGRSRVRAALEGICLAVGGLGRDRDPPSLIHLSVRRC